MRQWGGQVTSHDLILLYIPATRIMPLVKNNVKEPPYSKGTNFYRIQFEFRSSNNRDTFNYP